MRICSGFPVFIKIKACQWSRVCVRNLLFTFGTVQPSNSSLEHGGIPDDFYDPAGFKPTTSQCLGRHSTTEPLSSSSRRLCSKLTLLFLFKLYECHKMKLFLVNIDASEDFIQLITLRNIYFSFFFNFASLKFHHF